MGHGASTSLTEFEARRLDVETSSAAAHLLPGFASATRLHSDLRDFELAIEDELHSGGPDDGMSSGPLRVAIAELIEEYPLRTREPAPALAVTEVEMSLLALERAIGAVRRDRQSEPPQPVPARSNFRPAARRLHAALADLEALEVGAAAADARQTVAKRSRVARVALLLDATCVLLSIAMAIFALRMIRDHTRTIEQRADEFERFAGRVAHDVRGPLAPAALALDLASKRLASDPPAARALGRGKHSLQLAVSIIDGLLGFAHAGASPEPGARASVPEVIAHVMSDVQPEATEKGVAVTLGNLDEANVACSPGVLSSILSNLLYNAVKFTAVASERQVTVRDRAASKSVIVEVEDTGPGIPSDLREMVFEPHVRGAGSHVAGIGLGLATVKRLVSAHRGAVGIREGAHGGSVFWFELPRFTTHASASRAPGADGNRPKLDA